MKRILVLAAINVAAIAAIAVVSADGKTRFDTLKLVLRAGPSSEVDNPPAGRSQGDIVVTTDTVEAKGKTEGRARSVCIVATGTISECHGEMVFANGRIFFQSPLIEGTARYTGAIVGGTKSFAAARGYLTYTPRGSGRVDVTGYFVR